MGQSCSVSGAAAGKAMAGKAVAGEAVAGKVAACVGRRLTCVSTLLNSPAAKVLRAARKTCTSAS